MSMNTGSLMRNLINEVNKKNRKQQAEKATKKFSGLLPDYQVEILKDSEPKEFGSHSQTRLNTNMPYKDKNHILKQSTVRENLICEVDLRKANKHSE